MDVLIRVASCLLVLKLGLSIVNGSCPPVGSYECIKFPLYSDRQYATCVTDSYMRTSSGYNHLCADRTETICWYQCMLEVHNEENGDVTDDCSCGQLNTTAKQDLPVECYSPSGDDCGWYTNCLEKRYPCKGDPATYAIDFAERICVLYGQHYRSFSYVGRSWIDAVRKCLQVKLVPSLRPGQQLTCAELRDFAFGTHSHCYLSPDGGRNSVCTLTATDYASMFWTLWEGFTDMGISKAYGVKSQVFDQLLTVSKSCIKMKIIDAVSNMFLIELSVIRFLDNWRRNKRSESGRNDSVSDVVSELTHQVSTTMRWEENHIMWFGYSVSVPYNNNTRNSTLNVRIVLASKGMYDLNAVNVPKVNVSSAIDDLSDAIVNGDLKFNLSKDINVTLFKVCSDINCSTSTFETVPQNYKPDTKYNEDEKSTLMRNVLIGCSVGVILCIIAGVILYKLRMKHAFSLKYLTF